MNAKAVADATAALAVNPGNINLLAARCLALLLNQKLPAAIADLNAANRINPQLPALQSLTVLARTMSGNSSPAYGTPLTRFVVRVGNGYGALRHEIQSGLLVQNVAEARDERAAAVRQFPMVAREMSAAIAGNTGGPAFFYVAVHAIQKRHFNSARLEFASLRAIYPLDNTILFYHAMCLATLHRRLARARRELSLVLCWLPALPQGYVYRALADADVGDVTHAQRDLRIVAGLDPNDTLHLGSVIQKVRRRMARMGNAKSVSGLLAALGAQAQKGGSGKALIQSATALAQAANRQVRFGDETYQNRLRRLVFAMDQKPNDAGRIAAVAWYLVRHVDEYGYALQPNGSHHWIRLQTPAEQREEIQYAGRLMQQALRLDQRNARAIAVGAVLGMRNGRYADAQTMTRAGLVAHPNNARLLVLESRLNAVAANQHTMNAATLRQTHVTSGIVGDWIITRTYYPSPAQLAQAGNLSSQAESALAASREKLARAAALLKGRARGVFYQAELDWYNYNNAAAAQAEAQAVHLAPKRFRYALFLSNILMALHHMNQFERARTRALNDLECGCTPLLVRTWVHIIHGRWKFAAGFLGAAQKVDPANPEIYAFKSVADEAQGKPAAALAETRQAMALLFAEAKLNGSAWLTESGAISPDSVGLLMRLRLREARMVWRTDTPMAANLCMANAKLGWRIAGPDLGDKVSSFLLPNPRQNLAQLPTPPIAASVLQACSEYATIALAATRHYKMAARQAQLADSYQQRLKTGTAYLGLWVRYPNPAQYYQARAKSFSRAGGAGGGP